MTKWKGRVFFTKELETALRSEEIDLAVHSFKDLETNQPDDLTIAAVSHRASPADVLLIKKDAVDENQKWNLKKNPIVGTSSARRKVQLLHHRPDVSIRDIRGNVPTRIGKLRDQDFDAIVLAKAGMDRLKVDVSDLHVFEFNPKEFVSAPAQGVLACQTRASHQRLIDVLQKVNQPEVSELVGVERKILNMFHGGCQMPLGAYCIQEGGKYRVWAAMADDSSAPLRSVHLESDHTKTLAQEAVDQLKKKEQA